MTETVAARLRRTLIEIDSQLLEILAPHTTLDDAGLQKVSALEHARTAAQRLLLAAEADEPKEGA